MIILNLFSDEDTEVTQPVQSPTGTKWQNKS